MYHHVVLLPPYEETVHSNPGQMMRLIWLCNDNSLLVPSPSFITIIHLSLLIKRLRIEVGCASTSPLSVCKYPGLSAAACLKREMILCRSVIKFPQQKVINLDLLTISFQVTEIVVEETPPFGQFFSLFSST